MFGEFWEENLKKPQIDAVVADGLKELSPWVKRIRYDIKENWTGQPGSFFRVVLSDEAFEPPNGGRVGPRAVHAISDRVHMSEVGLPSYFNFRSESEQETARDPAWSQAGWRNRWLLPTICWNRRISC